MLKVVNLSIEYQREKEVLQNLSFTLAAGEHLCIMGKSGSGKTTLLKALYGLLDVKTGTISWKGQEVLGPSFHLIPGAKFFKYVAQDFDLMPFTSVSENIGEFLSRFYPKEKEQRTQELLEVIEMTDFSNKKIIHLSGGQQQRVAIARALAKEPELILLDEPFGQIDNLRKKILKRKLFTYLKEKEISCILATHDGNDALSFSDHMMVLENQQVVARGTPENIYKDPVRLSVASLFDDANEVVVEGRALLLYPHQIKIVEKSPYKSVVSKSYFKGGYWLVEATFNSQIIFFQSIEKFLPKKEVFLSFTK